MYVASSVLHSSDLQCTIMRILIAQYLYTRRKPKCWPTVVKVQYILNDHEPINLVDVRLRFIFYHRRNKFRTRRNRG